VTTGLALLSSRPHSFVDTMLLCVQLGSDGNARLCMRVLKRLPGDTVVRVVSESMNAHTQVTLDHCQQVVDNIMHGKRAVGASDGSKKLVSGTVHRAMKSKERSTVVETAVSDLTNHQRQGLMRYDAS